MTRWSAITRTRGRRSALAYGSRSTTAAEDNLNRLVHHERGRYWGAAQIEFECGRRHLGKSDTVDAEAAARLVLSGEATATPKRRDGIVESIRVLQIARRSAIKARTQAGQQIRSLIVTAPAELHSELAHLTVKRQVERCARLRPHEGVAGATRRALRSLARRWQQLDQEVRELNHELHALVRTAAPRLLAEPGVGPDTAGKLLVIASGNVSRLRSDAAFAALCGVSRSKPQAARRSGIDSTRAATGKATVHSGRSPTTG